MPKQPVVSGRETIRALERGGFVFDHQDGSHVTMYNPQTDRHATVTIHGNKDLAPGTLRSILRQAGLRVEEFRRLLR